VERICRELQSRDAKEGVGAYEVAFIDAALGNKDEAFRWLDIAYEQHDPGLKFLRVDPCLDPIRSTIRPHPAACGLGDLKLSAGVGSVGVLLALDGNVDSIRLISNSRPPWWMYLIAHLLWRTRCTCGR
jgi:hypothetical protein